MERNKNIYGEENTQIDFKILPLINEKDYFQKVT